MTLLEFGESLALGLNRMSYTSMGRNHGMMIEHYWSPATIL